jgi:4-amino-4-deoxy-L-arabinose transferase-like glycosyltransferase
MASRADEYRKDPLKAASLFFAALLFCAFSFQLWYHADQTSPTIDEPTHILAGHRYWQCGDFGINPEHPPLVKLLAASSLNSRQLIEPAWPCGSRYTTQPEVFAAGAEFLIANGIDQTVVPARILAALLSLTFGASVFLMAFRMFGRWEAIVALALLAFEPNLIAHGSLVTTDMALTLGALLATWALYSYGEKPSWWRLGLAGMAFGFLFVTKHSALVFVPVLFVVFMLDAIFLREAGVVRILLRRLAAFGVVLLIGIAVLWSFYGFRYYALPGASEPMYALQEYINSNSIPAVANSMRAKAVVALGDYRLLPESYVLGLADVVASSDRSTAIFDRIFASGRWYFFPLSFLVKTSVPLLLLTIVGLFAAFFIPGKRREMIYLIAPAVFFFAFSMMAKINIGVRHILPVYGFSVIVAAAAAVWMGRRYVLVRYVMPAILLFHVLTAVRTAPYYIAFSNDLWGGTENTHRIFPGDSNLDWGQNEKFVAEYLAKENITDCWYAGWGNVELMRALQPCRLMPNTFPRREPPLTDALPKVIEGTILVNVANLPPRGGNEYVPLTLQKPVAVIGGSIFVYRGRFQVGLASAVSHAQRAEQLLRLGQVEEAVASARQAVQLADYDPRPHLSLGLALLRAGNKAEASLELAAVLETARGNLPLFRNLDARARFELQKMALE